MKRPIPPSNAGFSLVEVALALAVAGFCLISIIGLLPVAVNANLASSEQTVATGILSAVVADLRATPVSVPSGAAAAVSSQYGISIPAAGATAASAQLFFNAARQKVASAPAARYRVTVSFPAGSGGKAATVATVTVSWPAVVDPAANPAGSALAFAALDRN